VIWGGPTEISYTLKTDNSTFPSETIENFHQSTSN